MRVARRSNADNLSLTSSTSLDDSCDSNSADTEGRCPHLLRSGSSNNRAAVKQSQSKPLSSSLLMQQATYKIKQRRNGGGTKAGRDGRAAEIVASYEIDADGYLDRAENQQRSSNPNNKQQARIPSTVIKYMYKCGGFGKRAQSTASASDAAVDADAATASAGVSAYDATAAPDSAKREGDPAIETPRHDGDINEAPKPRQKTAVAKTQQRVGAKKSINKRNDICPSKSSRIEIESVAKPLETSAPSKSAVRPAAARTRMDKATARMPRAKDERSKEAEERPQRTERAAGVSRNSNESEESAASPTDVLISKWKLQRRMIAARRETCKASGHEQLRSHQQPLFEDRLLGRRQQVRPGCQIEEGRGGTSCREFGDGTDMR